MPRKAATASATEEPKKKATKKAVAVKKTTTAAKKAPAAKKTTAKAAATPEEEKPKRATRKKAVAAEPAPEIIAAAPEAPATPPPAPAPVPVVETPQAAAPATRDWQPRGNSAPAQQAPQQQQQRPQGAPRPLYIPREVEAFLIAAKIPIPTEKPQLDAIMAAMQAAKAAAYAASHASSGAPSAQQQPNPQRQEQRPQQQQQPQHPQQHQQREQRHPRERFQRQPREHREQREHRDPNDPQQQPQQMEARPEEPVELVETEGYCEISGKGFGFIRDPQRLFLPSPLDVFVTPELVKRYGLRDGHWLKVEARKNSRGLQINTIREINGQPPENAKTWPSFDDLTTISPIERIPLETVPERTTTRIIDLLTPIGKGQRGLIVAPPRTGKTTLLNHMADGVLKNHPDMKLMILLVDERPEEVTDFKRHFPNAELWASSNDMDIKSHTRIATLAIERAKRLVESGADVFILLDSITRLGRAFNNAMAGGGRTMSGGVDARALETPRKIFAAARNTEEAGSLTIVATALIDTGSRMDELIFQEFKGTGNSEIVLDRKISDQRIYPAIDILQSGTRREELIIPADQLHKINVIRRGLAGHKPIEAIERMLSFIKKFPTNEQLLREIPG